MPSIDEVQYVVVDRRGLDEGLDETAAAAPAAAPGVSVQPLILAWL